MHQPKALDQTNASLVLRQFRVITHAVRAQFRSLEAATGLGGAQVWALHVIRQSPGIGTSELAKRMEIQPSTASNLVRQLLAKGLIQVHRDQADRRIVHLQVQEEALSLLEGLTQPLEGLLPFALSHMPEGDLALLEQGLSKLIEILKQQNLVDEESGSRPLAQL